MGLGKVLGGSGAVLEGFMLGFPSFPLPSRRPRRRAKRAPRGLLSLAFSGFPSLAHASPACCYFPLLSLASLLYTISGISFLCTLAFPPSLSLFFFMCFLAFPRIL